MGTFQECMVEYKSQLAKGIIQQAYRGLMDYFAELRTHFQKRYPETEVSGSVYFGYMDMTYFSLVPQSLKERNLKIAVVFLHEAFRFEVWLAGVNKQVQAQTWKQIRDSGWNQYPLVPSIQGEDAILQQVLVADPADGLDPLAAVGRHEELLRNSNAYRDLVENQLVAE